MSQLSIDVQTVILASRRLIVVTVLAFVSGTCGPGPALSQQASPQQTVRSAPHLSPAQIDQLVAPIALYPDNLFAQILVAATYPLEIVMAARWSAANPRVSGQALTNAMQSQSWQPSVKALTAVPSVLNMMNEMPEWTERLGKAYLSQPHDIVAAVQRLRARADASGNLKSSAQIRVQRVAAELPLETDSAEYIIIEPTYSDRIFVPVYDPFVVYGDWPHPDYRPVYWSPGNVTSVVFGFGPAVFVGSALWASFNWKQGQVFINPGMYSNFNRVSIGRANELAATNLNSQARNAATGSGNARPGSSGPPGGPAVTRFHGAPEGNRDMTNSPGKLRDTVIGGAGREGVHGKSKATNKTTTSRTSRVWTSRMRKKR